jgi:hypothetical protein
MAPVSGVFWLFIFWVFWSFLYEKRELSLNVLAIFSIFVDLSLPQIHSSFPMKWVRFCYRRQAVNPKTGMSKS